MNAIPRILGWSVVVGTACFVFDWMDLFHLAIAVSLFTAIAVVSLIPNRKASRRDVRFKDGTLRVFLASAVKAALFTMVLALTFFVTDHVLGLGPRYVDRDRESFERNLALLESTGAFQRGIDEIQERLGRDASDQYTRSLLEHQYRFTVAGAEQLTGSDQRIERYEEAVAIAKSIGVDPAPATIRLSQERAWQEIRQQISIVPDTEQKRLNRIYQIAGAMQLDDPGGRASSLPIQLYQALLDHAEHVVSLSERSELLCWAGRVASEHDIDDSAAARSLKLVGELREHDDQVYQQLQSLLKSRNDSQVVELLGPYCRDVPRPRWQGPYAVHLFEAYCRLSMSADQHSERQAWCDKARQCAEEHQVSTLTLDTLQRWWDHQYAAEDSIEAHYEQLHEEKRFDEIAVLADMLVSTDADHAGHWRSRRFQALVAAGDRASTNRQKLASYDAAIKFASQYELNAQVAVARRELVLQQVQIRERELAPMRLPETIHAAISRVDTRYGPPVIFLELTVTDAFGDAIRGIQRKDLQIHYGGKLITDFQIAPMRSELSRREVIVAIDCSGSMKGVPLSSAIAGTKVLLAGIGDPSVTIRIMGFSDQHWWTTDGWSNDFSAAAISCDQLRAGGGTALLASIAAALEAFSVDASKHLVLLTDGCDSSGGQRHPDLIARCQQQGVSVHTIGLRSRDLDRQLLEQLAVATGGNFLEAERPEQLISGFKVTSRQIQRSGYRIALLTRKPIDAKELQANLTVEIGQHKHLVAVSEAQVQ